MDRPTILLAIADQADPYVAALERAGFEPLTVDPSSLAAVPPVDLRELIEQRATLRRYVDAPLSLAESTDTIIWLATLPEDGPTGSFFYRREPMAW